MYTLPAFRVTRHCVPSGPEGLSPLQERILRDPSPVRIFSAPTGAGKSYAFQRAVVQYGKRVLFVVPTRRLAQNLARSLIEDPSQSGDEAIRRVVVWTSDERARHPEMNAGRLRFRQIRGLDLPDGGCMIIATPESVVWMLLRPGFRPRGAPAIDLSDLARFDHVVFDEFHTIGAQGLGLAAAITQIAARACGSARVTFLSATPIDVGTPLAASGVPVECIRTASEQVVTGDDAATGDARAVHGDVDYRFVEGETMLGTLRANERAVRTCLDGGRQVVVVFDSLRDLNREKQDLAEWCEEMGVLRSERLALNSIDDSTSAAAGDDGLFDIGRQRDPMSYRVLLATSLVEMGVTFRAGLMVMDPGHDAASFMQRSGRVARGDQPGEVIVRITARSVDRTPWLRTLMNELPDDGSSIEIDPFTKIVLASDRRKFDCGGSDLTDDPPGTFRSMPQRAVWCAAVFWAALEKADHLHLGQRRALRSFSPGKAKYVLARLGEIDESGLESAARWSKSFLREALCFRIILPRIKFADVTGNRRSIPWNMYASHVDLRNAPFVMRDNGDVELRLDRRLDEVVRTSETTRWNRYVDALFPHEHQIVSIDEREQSKAWLREARVALRSPLSAAQQKALEAARILVRLSGIVPHDDPVNAETAGETVIL